MHSSRWCTLSPSIKNDVNVRKTEESLVIYIYITFSRGGYIYTWAQAGERSGRSDAYIWVWDINYREGSGVMDGIYMMLEDALPCAHASSPIPPPPPIRSLGGGGRWADGGESWKEETGRASPLPSFFLDYPPPPGTLPRFNRPPQPTLSHPSLNPWPLIGIGFGSG